MKKIKLTANSPFFRQEQFDAEIINGKETAVMKISREEYLSESFMFSLYSRELEALPYEKNPGERKYLCRLANDNNTGDLRTFTLEEVDFAYNKFISTSGKLKEEKTHRIGFSQS